MSASKLLLCAADEVARRAGLAGVTVPSMTADPDHIPLAIGLGDGTRANFDHLIGLCWCRCDHAGPVG